jgi:predicted  nucleic acid-binding Zn-ribbon protein
MKADVWQQHSLANLAELDAELSRLAHRGTHLGEQQRLDAITAEHQAATDRAAVLQIAIDDVDGQVARLESEIDGVRQREDRDRGLLGSATTSSKQLTELQHEMGTLERRQSSLEDSLLEVMERREELTGQQSVDAADVGRLEAELAAARVVRDAALAEVDQARSERTERRESLAAGLDAKLLAAYERQRAATGIGAGLLQGRRCGACRIEIDHGEMSRIAAAAEDEVLRCPECNAILLRVKG